MVQSIPQCSSGFLDGYAIRITVKSWFFSMPLDNYPRDYHYIYLVWQLYRLEFYFAIVKISIVVKTRRNKVKITVSTYGSDVYRMTVFLRLPFEDMV